MELMEIRSERTQPQRTLYRSINTCERQNLIWYNHRRRDARNKFRNNFFKGLFLFNENDFYDVGYEHSQRFNK